MQRIVNDILTSYFGLAADAASSSLDRYWRLEAAWNWQTWPFISLLVVIVLSTVALTKISTRNRSAGLFAILLACRFLTLFLLLLIVVQVHFKTRVYAKPTLSVLIDSSGSMALKDSYSERDLKRFDKLGISQASETRIEIVKSLLNSNQSDWFAKLGRNYDLKFFAFDSEVRQFEDWRSKIGSSNDDSPRNIAVGEIQANGIATDFESSLNELIRQSKDLSSVGVILFSDGRPTSHSTSVAKQLASKFERIQLPIYSVGIGVPSSAVDVAIQKSLVEPVGFAGDDHLLTVFVTTNQSLNAPLRFTASHLKTGDIVNEVLIESFNEQGVCQAEVVIPILAAATNEYRIEVAASAGETKLQNNRQIVRIWGYDEKLNVLMIDQEPRWEFRHLKTTLERDRHLVLETFLVEGDPGYVVEDRTALSQLPERFDQYDAVVLGDIDFNLLPNEFDVALEEFVNRQGGLLLLSGERSLQSIDLTSALSDLHPALLRPNANVAERTKAEVRLAAEGRAQRLFPATETDELKGEVLDLYPRRFDVLKKTSALVLIEGISSQQATNSFPLVLAMRYGGGTVTQHLFDDAWRWRVIGGGEFFRSFWRQTIRNQCRQKLAEQLPPIEFFTDQETYRSSDEVNVVLIDRENQFEDVEAIPAVWRLNAQLLGEVALQRELSDTSTFTATIKNPGPGEHTVTLPLSTTPGPAIGVRFAVTKVNTENDYYPLETEFLQILAEKSGGRFLFPWELEELPDVLPDAQFPGAAETFIIPVWNRWEIVTFLVCMLTIDWIVRRRYGLD